MSHDPDHSNFGGGLSSTGYHLVTTSNLSKDEDYNLAYSGSGVLE